MANEKILSEKKRQVDELAEKLQSAVSVVLVDYKGISVSDDTSLRAEMRAADVEYRVVKNSMLKFACEKAGFDGFLPALDGSTAVAMSAEDAIAPARVVQKYSDKLRDIFNTKLGCIDGKFLAPDEVKAIAKLPGREVLIAQVAGSLNSIIAAVARAVGEVAKQKEAAA